MLAKAILEHGVIGYKFCWLLPEDQNQGTPAGHESNGTTVRDHWEDMNQLRHQLGTNHCMLKSMSIYQNDSDGTIKFNFVTSCLAFRVSILIESKGQIHISIWVFDWIKLKNKINHHL